MPRGYRHVDGQGMKLPSRAAGARSTLFSKRVCCCSCVLSIAVVCYITWLLRIQKGRAVRFDKGEVAFKAAVVIAGLFVVGACGITFHSIRLHYRYSKQPRIRIYTVRILLMIPVYSVEAWLAIVFAKYAVMFKVLREGYEAFVVISFMQLMLTYLGGPIVLAHDLVRKNQPHPHMFPLNCMGVREWQGAEFVRHTLIGTLQYVPASILVVIVSFSTWLAGKYKEGEMSFNYGWAYCVFITNCSQMWALYCLILFSQATKDELAPIRPLPKFLCVKLIIFFTWWQGLVIECLTHFELLTLTPAATQQLQAFVICLEMLLLAVAHSLAFPCDEFTSKYNPRSRAAALADQWELQHSPRRSNSDSSNNNGSSDACTPRGAGDAKANGADISTRSGNGRHAGGGADGTEDESYSSPTNYHVKAEQAAAMSNNNGGENDCDSPRSLPERVINATLGPLLDVSRHVEQFERFTEGVVGTAEDVMEGVNLLDIWRALYQVRELDRDRVAISVRREQELVSRAHSGGSSTEDDTGDESSLWRSKPSNSALGSGRPRLSTIGNRLIVAQRMDSKKETEEEENKPANKQELAHAWDMSVL